MSNYFVLFFFIKKNHIYFKFESFVCMDYIVYWMIISFIPLIALYSVNTQKLFVLNELIIKSMYFFKYEEKQAS